MRKIVATFAAIACLVAVGFAVRAATLAPSVAFLTSLGDVSVTRGTVAINGASPQTVAAPLVTANSVVIFTLKTVGGTVGALPAIQTITPGTGFTVQGTASDTSTYNYIIIF